MVESRDGSENLDSHVIHGTRYVDEIVRFEKNGQGTMFVFQDANWNVTSTVNYDGVPLDRIYTTPYGQPTFDTETLNGDGDGDGIIDGDTDEALFDLCNGFSDPPTLECRVYDFDNDEDIDSADQTRFDELYPGTPEIYRQPARRTSANGFPFAHQGLMLDEETFTYQNRRRQYNPWQQRFMQRDPAAIHNAAAAYFDGMSLYEYVRSRPLSNRDPSGLTCLPGAMTSGPSYYAPCTSWGVSGRQVRRVCKRCVFIPGASPPIFWSSRVVRGDCRTRCWGSLTVPVCPVAGGTPISQECLNFATDQSLTNCQACCSDFMPPGEQATSCYNECGAFD